MDASYHLLSLFVSLQFHSQLLVKGLTLINYNIIKQKDFKNMISGEYDSEFYKIMVEKNKAEINNLRESMFEAEGFISSDPIMNEWKDTLIRVAPLAVSVFIQSKQRTLY